ncbi:Gfo/Idh/MocA family oxidoreductase [Candidatus Riflebacteria bacterium]
MDKVKVAVVGTGHMGRHHVRIYNEMPEVELIGVCDIRKDLGMEYAQQFQTTFFENYKDLIPKVEAVSIAVPTNLHHKITGFLLENGVHCMLEKPIACNLEEAEDLLQISRKTNTILEVGHVERFNSAILKIAEFINKPRYIESNRLGPFSPRVKDIGVVQDLMIHDVDIILNLVKDKIKRIDAVGINVITDYDDIAHAHVVFENGCIANLNASRLSDEEMRKLRIFQDDMYVSLDYAKQEVFIQKLQSGSITKETVPISKEEPLKLELAHFISCVMNKKNPIVSGEQGKDALGVVLEILRNIHQRRKLWSGEHTNFEDEQTTQD